MLARGIGGWRMSGALGRTPPSVALAVTGLRTEPELRALLTGPVRQVHDVVELLGTCGAGLADLALVSARFPDFGSDVARRLAALGVPVYGVVDSDDDAGSRRLRDLRIPVLRVDGAGPLRRILTGERDPVSQARRPGPLIVVTGPPGSTGRTTVAINVAAELPRSLLIDADPVAPAIAFHLGLAAGASGILGASRLAEHGRLSPRGLLALAHRVDGSHAVLTGLSRPERLVELRTGGAQGLWRVAAAMPLPVLVDAGALPGRTALHRSLYAAADRIVVVAAPSALGIRRLSDASPIVPALSAAPVTVVWNGLPSGRAGRRQLHRLQRVVAELAAEAAGVGLPRDPGAAAANDVTPGALAVVAPRSALRSALGRLAASLVT